MYKATEKPEVINMDVSEDRHVNEQEAAKFIGLAVSTLRNRRCLGVEPAYFKVGRKVVYSLAELRQWMAERRITPGGEAK